MTRRRRRQLDPTFNCLTPFIRFWGVLTAIGKKDLCVFDTISSDLIGTYMLNNF